MEEFCPTINAQRLDLEWLRQADMVYSVGLRLADAKRVLDTRKNKQKVFAAELAQDIRSNPAAYDIVKLTESALEYVITSNPTYVEMAQHVINLQYDVDVLTAADKAMIHKREALQNLTDLLGRHYIADRPAAKPRRSETT